MQPAHAARVQHLVIPSQVNQRRVEGDAIGCGIHPVPWDGRSRVLAVIPDQPELVAGEDHRDARHRHRETQCDRNCPRRRVREKPRRIVRVQRVHIVQPHPPRESGGEAGVRLEHLAAAVARNRAERQPEVARIALTGRQPAPDRPREIRVGHGAMPRVTLEVARRIVGRLAQQNGVGIHVDHGRSNDAPNVGVEILIEIPTSHVGHVDAPAVEVERRLQPLRDHRVLALDEAVPKFLRVPVELRQAGHAQPRHVGLLLPVEPVIEGALGSSRVLMGCPEPLMRIPRMIRGEVANHPHTPRVRSLDQRGVGSIPSEQRVDLGERQRVVAVVRARREDGREIDEVHAELLQVIEVFLDAEQVAAVELCGRGCADVSDRV